MFGSHWRQRSTSTTDVYTRRIGRANVCAADTPNDVATIDEHASLSCMIETQEAVKKIEESLSIRNRVRHDWGPQISRSLTATRTSANTPKSVTLSTRFE